MELGVIIHYLMDAYSPVEVTPKMNVREKLPPSVFAPANLDTDQWIRSAVKMGAKYAVLVANHSTGFSLWPTDANGYSVKNSPWKSGKGDIVEEFMLSCEKYGAKPGIYYSVPANSYYGIHDEKDTLTDDYKKYIKIVEKQLFELWTRYGPLFEIWFDGGCLPVEMGGPDVLPMLNQYQADAICFQGPKGHRNNVRWVGNERGLAPENCWSATNISEAAFDGTEENEDAGEGNPDGRYWQPAETDMPNRHFKAAGGGWSWRKGEKKYRHCVEHLMDCYCRSVGRNSNLLMGMGISADGTFEDEDQLEAFGNRIRETFGAPLAIISDIKGTKAVLHAAAPVKADYIVIREDISNGHSIRGFSVFADGKRICKSECVGNKRIIPVKGVKASEFILEIEKSTDIPVIRDFAVY